MTKHLITVQNKRYEYQLWPVEKGSTRVKCKAANIDQEFLNDDIPGLLNDLPNLILAEKEYKKKQNDVIRFRVSTEDKRTIEKKAISSGFRSVSEYLRGMILG